MLEINVKITVAPGEQYTPVESAVIEALQSASSIGTTQTTEATIAPTAPAAQPAAAPAPKAAPKAAPAKRTAPAKASTTQAAVLEDDTATVAEPEAEDEDLVGGSEEVEYSSAELVTKATAVSKLKDGRAKLKAALAAVNAAHGTGYKTVTEIEDADARRTFMSELG